MMAMRTIEDVYQEALKVKDKLRRKESHRRRRKIPNKGRGITIEKFHKFRG
jgi:hypothetical protein